MLTLEGEPLTPSGAEVKAFKVGKLGYPKNVDVSYSILKKYISLKSFRQDLHAYMCYLSPIVLKLYAFKIFDISILHDFFPVILLYIPIFLSDLKLFFIVS